MLPDGCMDIIWGPDGLQVAGPDTRAQLFPRDPSTRYVAVRFRPGGAGGVLGVPADALTNARPPLSELWGPAYDWRAPPQRLEDLAALRAMVEDRLQADSALPDPAVPALRRALDAGHPIKQVAAELGFSERQLRRRSLAAFGYGPKTLQRILRFQRALGRARRGDPLAQVAYDCGYADQAHLASEVKSLAGVPVTQLG